MDEKFKKLTEELVDIARDTQLSMQHRLIELMLNLGEDPTDAYLWKLRREQLIQLLRADLTKL